MKTIKYNEEILVAYNERQIQKIRKIGNRLICGIDINVDDFVKYSRTSQNDIKLELGIIPKSIKSRIYNDIGIDIGERSLVLSSSGINHSINNHSKEARHLSKKEIPISEEDFNYIASIILNYNKVEYKIERNDKGQIEKKLVFSTNTDRGFGYKLIEINLINGYEMVLKDLYKYNKKRFITSVDTDKSAPTQTSKKRMSSTSK